MDFPYPQSSDQLEFNQRYFGKFRCSECNRWWKSANSWLGYGQRCERCNRMVYPVELSSLKLPSKTENDDYDSKNKPHPQDRCERCRALGYYCRNSTATQRFSSKSTTTRQSHRFEQDFYQRNDQGCCTIL